MSDQFHDQLWFGFYVKAKVVTMQQSHSVRNEQIGEVNQHLLVKLMFHVQVMSSTDKSLS